MDRHEPGPLGSKQLFDVPQALGGEAGQDAE